MAREQARERILVVGAGNAGLAVAARLSELGVPALVLDKNDRHGGQLHVSSGHFSAAGTRRQQENGITDSPRQHVEDIGRIGHGRATAALVDLATRVAAEAVDWLDDLGFPFAEGCPTIVRGHEAYSVPRTYWGHTPFGGGRDILATLERRIDPAVVRTRLNVRVTRLLTEKDAAGRLRVTGVEVAGPQGTERIEADHVVLATGGYAADRELLARWQPEYAWALIGCLPHSTGDGHRMLLEYGVPITKEDTYIPTMGLVEDPDRPGFGLPLSQARVVVDAYTRPPWEIWVNAAGERFVDETTPHPDVRERALLAQPGMAMWSIFDERALTEAPTPPIGPAWTVEALRSEARKGHWIWRAETLADLAAQTGLPADGLTDTVRAYNEGRTGPDPLGREFRPVPIGRPPFYAMRTAGGMLLSRGGPVVDDELRPVGPDGTPIEGLYAVGEILGMGQFSGDAFAGGMSVGPALSLGRWLAGQLAARTGHPVGQ